MIPLAGREGGASKEFFNQKNASQHRRPSTPPSFLCLCPHPRFSSRSSPPPSALPPVVRLAAFASSLSPSSRVPLSGNHFTATRHATSGTVAMLQGPRKIFRMCFVLGNDGFDHLDYLLLSKFLLIGESDHDFQLDPTWRTCTAVCTPCCLLWHGPCRPTTASSAALLCPRGVNCPISPQKKKTTPAGFYESQKCNDM